jgi:hypothetical protein
MQGALRLFLIRIVAHTAAPHVNIIIATSAKIGYMVLPPRLNAGSLLQLLSGALTFVFRTLPLSPQCGRLWD